MADPESPSESASAVEQGTVGRAEIDRLRAEIAELKRTEAMATFLAAAVESSDDSVVTIDFNSIITTWNAAAERLYGYTAAEAIGKPLTMLTLPSDLQMILGRIEQIRTGEFVGTFETIRTHKGDHEMCLAITLSPVKDRSGRVVGVSTIARDITGQKAADEALRANEEQFRRAIEDAPIPVIMHAEDGQVLQISRTWTELTGYTPEDIPTFDAWLNHAYGPGADLVRDHVQHLFSAEVPRMHVEVGVITRSGEQRWWAFSASAPGTLRDGRRYIVGMALDITDRKAIEYALRDSQERLRLVIENARDYAIFSMNLERQITIWNSGAQAILGYTDEEAIGQLGDILFTAEDQAAGAPAQEAATALATGSATDERWHVRKDGSRLWGSGMMMAMRDTTCQAIGFVKIFRDQTKEVQAKDALKQSHAELAAALRETERAREQAESAGRAKDHFLAVISHELRTPLTPVAVALRMLSRDKTLPQTVQEALAMIQRNVLLEARFVDDLLDVTRISRGKLELVSGPVDVHEVIRHAAEVAAPEIEEKNLRLTLSLEAREHRMYGDAMRLQQIFWNLLKNSSKFTPEGGSISITSRNEPGWIHIEVRDTGIGFEADAAKRIFEPFEQANQSVTREFGGLGLGLAISKASVEGHGGRIHANSDGPWKGAVITVELPLTSGGFTEEAP